MSASTNVTIGPWTFDHVSHDIEADVLYLSIGEPHRAVGEETPEGHIALFDEATGEFCGLTLVGVSRLLEGKEQIISVPVRELQQERIESSDLKLALT